MDSIGEAWTGRRIAFLGLGRMGLPMARRLVASTGRNNSTENKLAPFVIPRSYGSGFSLGLTAKDLRTAGDLARRLDVPAPFSRACAALWDEALEALGPDADHTEIDRYLAAPEPSRSGERAT